MQTIISILSGFNVICLVFFGIYYSVVDLNQIFTFDPFPVSYSIRCDYCQKTYEMSEDMSNDNLLQSILFLIGMTPIYIEQAICRIANVI